MKINIIGTWLSCPPLYTECDSLFFHRPDCLHNTHFPVSSCSILRCQCCFWAIASSLFARFNCQSSSLSLAINAPTQTAHVTLGARHCACAPRPYYAPFPARQRAVAISAARRRILSGHSAPDWSYPVQVLSLAHAYLASSFERRFEIKNNCQELPVPTTYRPFSGGLYKRLRTIDGHQEGF